MCLGGGVFRPWSAHLSSMDKAELTPFNVKYAISVAFFAPQQDAQQCNPFILCNARSRKRILQWGEVVAMTLETGLEEYKGWQESLRMGTTVYSEKRY